MWWMSESDSKCVAMVSDEAELEVQVFSEAIPELVRL